MSATGAPYPRLDPAFRTLPPDSLAIWGDAGQRRQALEDVLRAWEAGSPALDRLIRRVDEAVVAGLATLGLPRGPIKGLRLRAGLPHLVGEKEPGCLLTFGAEGFHERLWLADDPDYIFRTWVHESLHDRQPLAPGARGEYQRYSGYEEGLVEGLARLVVIDKAGLAPRDLPYTYYVTGYETLAQVLEIDVERLWRALWRSPMGRVRADFPGVIGDLGHLHAGRRLTGRQQERLRAIADALFATERDTWRPDQETQTRTWRMALQ